jgi:hypothetical protein
MPTPARHCNPPRLILITPPPATSITTPTQAIIATITTNTNVPLSRPDCATRVFLPPFPISALEPTPCGMCRAGAEPAAGGGEDRPQAGRARDDHHNGQGGCALAQQQKFRQGGAEGAVGVGAGAEHERAQGAESNPSGNNQPSHDLNLPILNTPLRTAFSITAALTSIANRAEAAPTRALPSPVSDARNNPNHRHSSQSACISTTDAHLSSQKHLLRCLIHNTISYYYSVAD